MNEQTTALCGDTFPLQVMRSRQDRSYDDRVYTCDQPVGHVGAHVGGALMWPARASVRPKEQA